MNDEERLDILKKVESVAALAGLRGTIENGQFCMGFNLGGGRRQGVYVRPAGHTPDGKVVVTLFSPARILPTGVFRRLGRGEAIELLKLNEQMMFARFGLCEWENQMMVVASIDAIVDTLDTDEILAYAMFVSQAADDYESRYGGDQF
jgi:hypothetical protein